jgi:hypothetical protein
MTQGVLVFLDPHVPEHTRLIGFERRSARFARQVTTSKTRRGLLAGMTDEIYMRGGLYTKERSMERGAGSWEPYNVFTIRGPD